jgi:Flp pilus assembly protein TadD
MILELLAAGAAAAAQPVPAAPADPAPVVQPLSEAAHAIDAGRLDQARIMVSNAIKAGVRGKELDRVVADLAFASGDYHAALPAYRALLVGNAADRLLYEKAGLAALRVGKLDQAAPLLERATAFPQASWRAWNWRGVAADFHRDWTTADLAYERAEALAPERAEILNNLGWSLLARGRWIEAAQKLERAAALDPRSKRIAQNLELARAAMTDELPQRRSGESDGDWAARLNDAGVIARVQGNNKKAVAAFARAIEARSQYYARAANNLALAQAVK